MRSFIIISFIAILTISCTSQNNKALSSDASVEITDAPYSASITVSDQSGVNFTFTSQNVGGGEVSSYVWYIDGILQSYATSTISHTFSVIGSHSVQVQFLDSSSAVVASATISVSIPESTVSGGFTDNDNSEVEGTIEDAVSGIAIPFQIRDENGTVLYSGETETDGTFSVDLSSEVSTGGYYELKLYAKDYDVLSETFASAYTVIDDDFMCDVDDSSLNPEPYCKKLVIGDYVHEISANKKLPGLCEWDFDYATDTFPVDLPMGNIETVEITFTEQASSCGWDSYSAEILAKFWWLSSNVANKYIDTSNEVISVGAEANYVRLINNGISNNDIIVTAIKVTYSN